jgi:hypothetical protein
MSRYALRRVLENWHDRPEKLFAKCVIKHLRQSGLSGNALAAEFLRLLPLVPLLFSNLTAHKILQRADKGCRPGYESEWPDRAPSSALFWAPAGEFVRKGKPATNAELARLCVVPLPQDVIVRMTNENPAALVGQAGGARVSNNGVLSDG